ncbi:hypothetical protein LAZ40_11840 [Cereibacter sphaeroides]|uniref:hypothetical protein n=1 Tax=Cereibacter sphaeroides TaxID=1063 RepID=UPI001F48EE81|nr:hypothetical protein [Cereibacter sphaeroides]MCE6959711.1 hypothetical protein [Cereibacter sphaeroides]MCE6974428.1 hypothetical protein [Cereibacter sphaeroides]
MKKNPLLSVLSINWNAPTLRLADFGLALTAVAVGWYIESPLTMWGGGAACLVSALNPMGRVQKHVLGFRKQH